MTNDPPRAQQVSPRTRVRPLDTNVTPVPLQGVLGDDDEQPIGPFSEFVPAEAPFLIDIEQKPTAVPEAPMAVVDHQVPTDESTDFGYVLLHEVHTPDGIVYDITLPLQPDPGVLGDEDEGSAKTLHFPINHFMDTPRQGVMKSPRDSGVLGDDDDSFVDAITAPFQHIVRIVKAPVIGALDAFIASKEPAPTPLRVAADDTLLPLESAEEWRSMFDDPTREQRVLLYIHGFLSESKVSLPVRWLPWMRERYDAIVAYTHPTITRSPLVNVTDLIERIPQDLRLNIDVVAHSRGGLVARSLVELAPQVAQISIEKLMTCGTPHNGTPLAQREKWDKLASIILTASSWALTAAGTPFVVKLLPKLVEQILKAGSKHFFELPGVNALVPGNAFLNDLNATNTPSVMADRR